MLTVPNGQLCPVQVLTPSAPTFYRFPAPAKAHGRIFMCHGITTAPGASYWWPPGIGFQSTQQLVADGWECIALSYAEDFVPNDFLPAFTDLQTDPALGARWKATTLASFDNVVAVVEGMFGWMPKIIYGGSWGGWHSLTIAQARAAELIAYCVFSPMTVIGNPATPVGNPGQAGPGLTLLGNVYNYPFITSAADCSIGMLNGVTIPGLVRPASEWDKLVTDPYLTSEIATAAMNAGSPIAPRVVTDGAITGGTTLTSTQACFLADPNGVQVEDGAKISGSGVPSGTTISGISGSHPGPWTATLSQTCTNGTGLTLTFPNLCQVVDEPHNTTSNVADLAAIAAWFSTVIDPNYPMVY